MKLHEIKSMIKYLYDDIYYADYQKENYPKEIEDVMEKLSECLELLS